MTAAEEQPRPQFSALARVSGRLFGGDICQVTIVDDQLMLQRVGALQHGSGIRLRPQHAGEIVLHVPLDLVRVRSVKRGRAVRLWAGRQGGDGGVKRRTLHFQPSIEHTAAPYDWQRKLSEQFIVIVQEQGGTVDRG